MAALQLARTYQRGQVIYLTPHDRWSHLPNHKNPTHNQVSGAGDTQALPFAVGLPLPLGLHQLGEVLQRGESLSHVRMG